MMRLELLAISFQIGYILLKHPVYNDLSPGGVMSLDLGHQFLKIITFVIPH